MTKQIAQKHSDKFNNLRHAKYYYDDSFKEGYIIVA